MAKFSLYLVTLNRGNILATLKKGIYFCDVIIRIRSPNPNLDFGIRFWNLNILVPFFHRHLRKIDKLMPCTACLVCLISTVRDRSKKAKNSAHITKLEQPFSLDVYGLSETLSFTVQTFARTLATSPHLIHY